MGYVSINLLCSQQAANLESVLAEMRVRGMSYFSAHGQFWIKRHIKRPVEWIIRQYLNVNVLCHGRADLDSVIEAMRESNIPFASAAGSYWIKRELEGPVEHIIISKRAAAKPKTKIRNASSVVYFVECGEYLKIGLTNDLQGRMRGLQVGNPTKIKLVGWLSGGRMLEGGLHRRFAHLHCSGEWFRYDTDLRSYCKEKELRGERDLESERWIRVELQRRSEKALQKLTALAASVKYGR